MTQQHFIEEERSGGDAVSILEEGQEPRIMGEGSEAFATYALKDQKLVGIQMMNGCEVVAVGRYETIAQRLQQLRATAAISGRGV